MTRQMMTLQPPEGNKMFPDVLVLQLKSNTSAAPQQQDGATCDTIDIVDVVQKQQTKILHFQRVYVQHKSK